jgi:hypothetical protein
LSSLLQDAKVSDSEQTAQVRTAYSKKRKYGKLMPPMSAESLFQRLLIVSWQAWLSLPGKFRRPHPGTAKGIYDNPSAFKDLNPLSDSGFSH